MEMLHPAEPLASSTHYNRAKLKYGIHYTVKNRLQGFNVLRCAFVLTLGEQGNALN